MARGGARGLTGGYDAPMESSRAAHPLHDLVEAGCLPADPTAWLLESAEPSARLLTFTGILGLAPDHPDVLRAHDQVLRDDGVLELIARLPGPERVGQVDDHTSPWFAAHHLGLLADLGVRYGDDRRVDAVADALMESTDRQGRFVLPGSGGAPRPCDGAAITSALVRLGLGPEPRVAAALGRLAADGAAIGDGRGWRCSTQRRGLLDFSANRAPACPQVTLEAARALVHAPASRRPRWLDRVARTMLETWRVRGSERPYEFGHGYQFKTVKWPVFWYDALLVLEVVSHVPQVWSGSGARAEDREAAAQLAAALVAHNVDAHGRVTPARTYRGFERLSLGRRTAPSPFATAYVMAVLARMAPLADAIARVDSDTLAPSMPASAAARVSGPAARPCPAPRRNVYESSRALPRVLARHHLGTPWEPASVESLAADLVGLVAADPATPHFSMAARLQDFDATALDRALDERRSLVRIRCMRGVLYAVRRDMVPVVHAASTRQVVRWARDFARMRGVSPADYERVSSSVLDACADEPLTTAELRARLDPRVDLAAVVTLMCAEATLLRCAPRDGRFGRATTYAPFASELPDVVLGRVSEDDARAALLRAYVRGFGPVTVRDAAWWTGMDAKRVRRAFDALEDELVDIGFEGGEGTWLMHAADVEELERATITGGPHVALLPALDPLVMSYTDRSRFVSDEMRPFVFDAARNVAPVVLVDGRVAGVWDVSRGPEPAVLVHLFDPDPVIAALVEHAARPIARVRFGADTPVRRVERARPLTSRPLGAFRRPLR